MGKPRNIRVGDFPLRRTRHKTGDASLLAAPAAKTPPSEFGTLLRAAMERSGRTCVDVADVLGCKPGTIRNWRQGRERPGVQALEDLCEYLARDCGSWRADDETALRDAWASFVRPGDNRLDAKRIKSLEDELARATALTANLPEHAAEVAELRADVERLARERDDLIASNADRIRAHDMEISGWRTRYEGVVSQRDAHELNAKAARNEADILRRERDSAENLARGGWWSFAVVAVVGVIHWLLGHTGGAR